MIVSREIVIRSRGKNDVSRNIAWETLSDRRRSNGDTAVGSEGTRVRMAGGTGARNMHESSCEGRVDRASAKQTGEREVKVSLLEVSA